jgi:uncharacterized protein GlcG (DUF336 family)
MPYVTTDCAGVSLEVANAIIAAALAKARALELRPMGVAVLDAGGHVLSFQREDAGAQLRLQIASAKASGALALGMSSRAVEAVAKQYPSMMAKLDGMATAGMIAAPGALLIGDGQGRILGAVGVTGDSGDNDELCARVGIEEVGLMPIDG